MSQPNAGKVPAAYDFLDLSDYARPGARWLVTVLLNTRLSPIHLTLAFTAVGLMAAGLLAIGRGLWLAAGLLLLKSLLDGADGSLARARRAPSRVGRFLDSDCDFIVNVAVFAGIAYGAHSRGASPAVYLLTVLALISTVLQVSLFNRYYILYRGQTGGDQTSQVLEENTAGQPGDDPVWLARLFTAYRLIYAWQDSLVARLDGASTAHLTRRFMTATSVLGLGTQLFVIAICSVAGSPSWSLWIFVLGFNLYALFLLALRRLRSPAPQ